MLILITVTLIIVNQGNTVVQEIKTTDKIKETQIKKGVMRVASHEWQSQ